MRIGFKLVLSFIILLALMGALVFLGLDGEKRLSAHYTALVNLSRLENSISMVHKAVASGADKKVLAEMSDGLAKELNALAPSAGSEEAAVIKRASLANVQYKEKLDAWLAIKADVDRYISTALTHVKSVRDDVTRVSAIMAEQGAPLLSASSQAAKEKKDRLLASMKSNAEMVQIAMRLWEATWEKNEFDTAVNSAAQLLKSSTEMRELSSDKVLLDRIIENAKGVEAELAQLGKLYNKLQKTNTDVGSGLANVSVTIRQLADSEQDSIALVRESAVIPAVAVIAGAFIISLFFCVIILRSSNRFASSVEEVVNGIALGEKPEDESSVLDGALYDLWKKLSDQAVALDKLAHGKTIDVYEKNLGDDITSRAISLLDKTHRDLASKLGECLAECGVSSHDGVGAMLPEVKKCLHNMSATLSEIKEKSTELAQSGATLEKGISGAATQSLQAFEALHGQSETFDSLSAAVREASTSISAPSRSVTVPVADIQGQLAEVERSLKILGWQTASYEDFARQLETLAINVNVEAARVGAGTTAMGTIVEEIRTLADKCRQAAEASENGKTSGVRAIDSAYSGLNRLGQVDSKPVAQVDSAKLARAAQVLSQLNNVEKALSNIFTKAANVCSKFVAESAELATVAEKAGTKRTKVAQSEPISLTDKVEEEAPQKVTLPKLDL